MPATRPTDSQIRSAIRTACPDACQIEIEDDYASFRSWSFSKESEDCDGEEEIREFDLSRRLRELLPTMQFERGDKNYFDGNFDE